MKIIIENNNRLILSGRSDLNPVSVRLARQEMAAQGNLVVNGDFSNGLNGWTPSYTGPGAGPNYPPPPRVLAGAVLIGAGNNGTIIGVTQSIQTTPGANYHFSFKIRGADGINSWVSATVSFGDFNAEIRHESFGFPQTNALVSFNAEIWDFVVTASGTSSVLGFTSPQSGDSAIYVSDVNVQAATD